MFEARSEISKDPGYPNEARIKPTETYFNYEA